MTRFLRPGMQVTQNPINSAVVTHRGVFWKCGICGMKNMMKEPGCRMPGCRGHNAGL